MMTAALALSVVGTAVGVYGTIKQGQAMKKAEQLRKKQMDLDATRRRREIVRQATIARSTALANATASGSAQGSGLQGGQASITANAGNQIVQTNQAQEIGAGIFSANAQAAQYGTIASVGQGLGNLGNSMFNNYPVYKQLGWVQ